MAKKHEQNTNEVMSLKEVAEYFGVTVRTIREWMERDENFPIPFKKFGTLRLRRSEIKAYWDKNTGHYVE